VLGLLVLVPQVVLHLTRLCEPHRQALRLSTNTRPLLAIAFHLSELLATESSLPTPFCRDRQDQGNAAGTAKQGNADVGAELTSQFDSVTSAMELISDVRTSEIKFGLLSLEVGTPHNHRIKAGTVGGAVGKEWWSRTDHIWHGDDGGG
jgi:hypothetical protein